MYEKLLYPFAPAEGTAPQAQGAGTACTVFPGSAAISGAAFVSGYYLLTQPGMVSTGTHRHNGDEYLMLSSATMRLRDWDAELTLVLGEGDQAELVRITAPTTIRIPAGLAHGPLQVLRAGKPIVYQPALLAERYAAQAAAPAVPCPATGRYDGLIFVNQTERKGNYIDGSKIEETADDVVGLGFRGACQILGAGANLGGSLIETPLFIDPYPHKHPADELLAFLGRPEAPFDFDAEIRFTMGSGAAAEQFTITRPTIVHIPKDTWHCPLNFVRIGKPVFFQVNMLQGAFGGTYQMPNGVQELYFNGLISCILDPKKDCDCCHRCLSAVWKAE